MSRMRDTQALHRLIELMYENKDKDSQSVLEMWRTELEDYEATQLASQQAMLKESINGMRYGLQHGTNVAYTDAGGGESYERVIDKHIVVGHNKVAEMAKAQGIPEKEAWQLIRGEIREYKGWQGYKVPGLSNGVYIPTNRERLEQLDEMSREDAQIQKKALNYKPRPSIHTTPKVEVYE